MFRIALISRWHVHAHKPDERYVKEFLKHPDCCVTCVYDRDPDIAREWGAEYGVPYDTDLEAVLSRSDVDGILVTSQASEHREIFLAAAKHKKHIFTEKVLAFSMEDAYAIRDAIRQSGVKFCIAFTRLSVKQLAYAKTLVEEKAIGDPVYFRCMCGHDQGFRDLLPAYWYDPAVTGGGAMIDLGFNSAYLARYILGEMESVSSSFSDAILHKRVEDHASCNVRFRNGAMGLIEAGFDSPALSVFELTLYGTKGAYYARFGGADVAELRLSGEKNRIIPLSELSSPLRSPIETWIAACTDGGSDADYGIDAAIDLVAFMEAAYTSAKLDGKRVRIMREG